MMRVRSAGGCSKPLARMKTDPIRSPGALLLLSLLASSSFVATACATEVTIPKDHPKIKMQVPDDWTVTYSDLGVEIVAPEKNLVIVANLVPRKKAEANAWAITAEKRLEAFGVTFDKAPKDNAPKDNAPKDTAPQPALATASPPKPETEAKAAAPVKLPDTAPSAKPAPSAPPQVATAAKPAKTEAPASMASAPPPAPSMAGPPTSAPAASVPPTSAPPTSAPSLPMATAPASAPSVAAAKDVQPSPAKAAPKIPLDRTAPTFTFMNPPTKIEPPEEVPAPPAAAYFGPPSLDLPTKPIAPTAMQDNARSGSTLEELTRPPVVKPKIPFGEGHLPSATFDGKPIDVEIVNFSVSLTQLFVVLQASGPTDDRAVAIMRSVKPAT